MYGQAQEGYAGFYPCGVAESHGFDITDEVSPRTVYVGNFDVSVGEEFLKALFNNIGQVTKIKVFNEGSEEAYAFIELVDHPAAQQALTALNGRNLLGKELRVNWAVRTTAKVDTSKHFHVFVGDLSLEIDNKILKEAFAPYGECSDAKVIRDNTSLKSKGYGFVSYTKKEDAERAIEQMNGQWLGKRTIRTNWATRKPMEPRPKALNYDEVYASTVPSNTSVYLGGIPEHTTDDELRRVFSRFGNILETRVFKNQGFGFCRFDNKASACQAIVDMNGQEFMGQIIKCSWGKSQDMMMSGGPPSGGGGGGGGGGGYGYGYGYGGGAAPAQPPNFGPGGPGGPGSGPSGDPYQQYWQQYYAYYSNPQNMQEWQKYWAQQQNQG